MKMALICKADVLTRARGIEAAWQRLRAFLSWLRDRWRGYTQADVESLEAKWRAAEGAGEVIWLSRAESLAMRARRFTS